MKVTQKNLLTVFPKLDKTTALLITRLCNGTLDAADFPEGQRRINECYHRPSDVDITLNVLNKLIGGFGVEGVEYEEQAIYERDFIKFVNMGDTYRTTIVHNPQSNRYEISDWGSIYETSPAYQAATSQDETY